MKKIFFIFIIIALYIKSSIESNNILSTKVESGLKCIFSSKKNVEVLNSLVETFFKESSVIYYLDSVFKTGDIMKECFNINIMDIIKEYMPLTNSPKLQSSLKTALILNKIQKSNAPILLRKYLFDTIDKTDLISAKKECIVVTSQHPYEQYNYICDLL